ncbi:hypothetical protein B0H14DRAFT_3422146 [Mycena olivaceomarginata]|nr:hypothetical protein B0H14DRAFT_3422146 [Mycena olivaceomarginata]
MMTDAYHNPYSSEPFDNSMSPQSGSSEKIEEQGTKNMQMATTEAPYMAATHVLAAAVKTLAAAAQTLAERQPLPSPPRSGPETPMISVEDAEKQADKFRTEIATLTARVDALQAANRRTHYAAEREIQILKETHARECADLRAQLKTAWVGERAEPAEAVQYGRESEW